jgi:hypothetical protein
VEFRIWVETRLTGRLLDRQLVAQVDRAYTGPEEIGLILEEGKSVLHQVQACMIEKQVEVLQAASWPCVHCGRKQRIKDRRTRRVRTVFGNVRVSCRRYIRCQCQGGKRITVWPLHRRQLPATTPELQYLYANWGSRVPYRRAAAVVEEMLPMAAGRVSHVTLWRQTLKVGARLDQRVSEPAEYDWPEPTRQPVPAAKSMSVAIDGTYIRADRMRGLREYHVVAGRVERDGHLGGHFAWVAQHRTCDERTFMKAALADNGWTSQSEVKVLADGADGFSNLVDTAAGKKTGRILDWFHISMRLRPIEQMSAGIAKAADSSDSVLQELLNEKLPRIRYQIWNGKWRAALDRLRKVHTATKQLVDSVSPDDAERVHRFRQHLKGLRQYLHSNWSGLKNYAAEWRNGRRISSALAESAMSHLVNQRMGKRQPMRWSSKGAHFLLQVRCAVLDNRLDSLFHEWYPYFRSPRLRHNLWYSRPHF